MKCGTILVADGDVATVQEIRAQLARLSFGMLWAQNGREVIKSLIHYMPDAIILRDTLPDFDGWETARLIRAISDTPIIFISMAQASSTARRPRQSRLRNDEASADAS